MKQQLKILISNDDGINARGIKTLETHLAEIAEVLVVAPDRDRSGASSSLTLGLPIRIRRLDENRWCILGTPTDSVHLALTGMLQERPDMVVSGINAGANLGDDVLYSGTVAAAIEGRFLGLPAIAISLVYKGRPENFDTASRVAVMVVKRLEASPLPADTILNINVPDLSWDEIQGIRVTRLGRRHQAEAAIADKDPHGRPVYWIGPPGEAEDAGPGTDFDAIRNGYVSVTPLQIDLTHYQAMEQLGSWCKSLDIGRNGK